MVTVEARTWLHWTSRYRSGRLEVATRDIGATIGTEIRDEDGNLIVAYRPGTRYPDTAVEIAAEHVRRAVPFAMGMLGRFFSEALAETLREIVTEDGYRPWNPEEEEETW